MKGVLDSLVGAEGAEYYQLEPTVQGSGPYRETQDERSACHISSMCPHVKNPFF
jgi:hypothetical protein